MRIEIWVGKRKNFIKKGGTIRMFSFVLTKWILLSTIWWIRWSPSLSREGNVLHAFHLWSFWILTFIQENIPLCSCNPWGLHGPKNPFRILADLWALAHTDLRILWFAQTANRVCGRYLFSPEQETCCKLSFCRTIAFLTYNAETGIPSCNLPFSSTASLWTSIDKPIKLLLSWKKGGTIEDGG